MRQQMMMHPPYRRDDAVLVRGDTGLYWQARDGFMVRVAAREHLPRHDEPQSRGLEACAEEGGVVHASRGLARQGMHARALALASAWWLRLFARAA